MEDNAVEEVEVSGAVDEAEVSGAVEETEVSGAAEFAPALVAAHPFGHSVAVAVGPDLRVFDLYGDGCAVSLSDDSGGCAHSDAIRAISFSSGGKLFASAGDDKLVKVWKSDSWRCIRTITSEKRVSAVAFSNNDLYVAFADKFGVVWLDTVGEDGEGQVSADSKPVSIFGHYCSIITSMKFSPDGRFIATADRDFKIRVTSFPKNPIKGATEIQSFCLGHTEFVSCIAFTRISGKSSFLVSGGGDSTVRLWDHISGCLLDTYNVKDKVVELSEPNETEDSNLAIADICLALNNSLVAVAIQSLNGMMLLALDLVAKKLSFLKVIRTEKSYIPTSLSTSHAPDDHLWTVMGASNLPNQSASQLITRVRILPHLQMQTSANEDFADVFEDSEVPHGEKLLLALQGSLDASKQEEVLAAVLAALKVSMHKMLVKKNYSEERREQRKRGRNDKKIKK